MPKKMAQIGEMASANCCTVYRDGMLAGVVQNGEGVVQVSEFYEQAYSLFCSDPIVTAFDVGTALQLLYAGYTAYQRAGEKYLYQTGVDL